MIDYVPHSVPNSCIMLKVTGIKIDSDEIIEVVLNEEEYHTKAVPGIRKILLVQDITEKKNESN